MLRPLRPGVLAGVVAVALPAAASAQGFATLTAAGDHTQNFDLLRGNNAGLTAIPGATNAVNSAPFTTAAAPNALDGWIWRVGSGGRSTSFRRDDGSDATNGGLGGGGYSFGNAFNDGEAALGVLTTANTGSYFGVVVRNDTGAAQAAVTVSYTGEQWRFGGRTDGSADQLTVRYILGQNSLPGPAAGTAVPELTFSSPVTTGAARPLNGNLDARIGISQTITFGADLWDPNEFLVIAWYDADVAGLDDGLAVDNFRLSLTPVPEPTGLLALGAAGVGLVRAVRRWGRASR